MGRVLMLSWEYPPRVVGGISSHVRDLSTALAMRGNEVDIVTPEFPDAPAEEEVKVAQGVIRVHRVPSYDRPAPNFSTWISFMNFSMEQRSIGLLRDENFDLIHAHDWVVAESAVGLKHLARIPMLSTIHATERGRRGGIFSQLSAHIDQEERWLVSESWKVIVCSHAMADQARELGAFPDKINVIPNGVWPSEFTVKANIDFRRRFASDEERLILFVGRLVHEKGVLELLTAFKYVLNSFNAKLVMVGEGYLKEDLYRLANQLGISERVYLTVFVEESVKKSLYSVADVLVVPSIYEPFGIVALEGMASGVPVVVSDVGGLHEIIIHGRNGVKVYPGDPSSIAWGISYVLSDPVRAKRMAEQAKADVTRNYSWDTIAASTVTVYNAVLSEYKKSAWKVKEKVGTFS